MTRSLSNRNFSIDLHDKSMHWFLYDRDPFRKELKRFSRNLVSLLVDLTEAIKLLIIFFAFEGYMLNRWFNLQLGPPS